MAGSRRWTRLGISLALAAGACAAGHVELVVEDAAGKPVPGAVVSCASLSMNLNGLYTNRRGRVNVPRSVGVQPLRWCEVRKEGYGRAGPLEVPEQAGRIRVTLHERGAGEPE